MRREQCPCESCEGKRGDLEIEMVVWNVGKNVEKVD
jgi:hypothetical protein